MTHPRRNFTLEPDVAAAVDALPDGTRSATVSAALRVHLGLGEPEAPPARLTPLAAWVLTDLRLRPATVRHLAAKAGSTPASVARALTELRAAGLARPSSEPGARVGASGPPPVLWEAVPEIDGQA